MKLCSSLLFSAAAVTAQYADDASADRWGGAYEYDSGFTYPAGVKNDGGNSGSDDLNHDGLNHFNGLHCWMCDERLDLGTEAETSTVNAYARCLLNGMAMKCKGEQRTCMFEERRRNGVVYSVCTGCKQTDACLALWRRNQRFTLPFMNFGDMSLEHTDGKPIYVDDECTAYQEVNDSSKAQLGATTAGLSYAKFSYDTDGANQENGQMSQWESSCRWCCAAKSDSLCNVIGTDLNSNPFATQCTGAVSTGTTANLLLALTAASITPDFTGVTCGLSNAPISGGTYNGRQRFFHPFQLVDAMGTDGLYTTPKMWIDEFVKTAMIDLAGAASGNPVTGEGRNSVGMDKYKFRGNSYTNGGSDFAEHIFEHQSDMPSQENRDFFDARIENAV